MPPLIKTAPRDETYIKRLETEVGVFVDDVGELVDRLRGDPDKLRRQLADSVLLAG
jgi:hypothetical protein